MKKRLMALALVAIIAIAGVAGYTLAWLQDTTETVTNTFTEGKVDIDLWEYDYIQSSNSLDTTKKVTSENEYKMGPGNVLPKNPTVTVKAGSEPCYLFVKVEASANFATFMEYAVDTTKGSDTDAVVWTALEGVSNVYYMVIDDITAADTDYTILAGNATYTTGIVTVKESVTMADMNNNTTDPTLSFTAYAIQKANIATPADAWAKLGK